MSYSQVSFIHWNGSSSLLWNNWNNEGPRSIVSIYDQPFGILIHASHLVLNSTTQSRNPNPYPWTAEGMQREMGMWWGSLVRAAWEASHRQPSRCLLRGAMWPRLLKARDKEEKPSATASKRKHIYILCFSSSLKSGKSTTWPRTYFEATRDVWESVLDGGTSSLVGIEGWGFEEGSNELNIKSRKHMFEHHLCVLMGRI